MVWTAGSLHLTQFVSLPRNFGGDHRRYWIYKWARYLFIYTFFARDQASSLQWNSQADPVGGHIWLLPSKSVDDSVSSSRGWRCLSSIRPHGAGTSSPPGQPLLPKRVAKMRSLCFSSDQIKLYYRHSGKHIKYTTKNKETFSFNCVINQESFQKSTSLLFWEG